MAASCPLPVTQDLSTLRAKLQGLLRFLREALSISNAHTVDFYTESVWEQLIDVPPETVLAVLKKSAEEAAARPAEARPLMEAERAAGEWRWEGRTGRQREDPTPRSALSGGPGAEAESWKTYSALGNSSFCACKAILGDSLPEPPGRS